MKELDKVIGTWSKLLGPEFYKPYMKELQKVLKIKKDSVFVTYNEESPLFRIFLKTPVSKLKVLYLVDTPAFDKYLLSNIEKQLRGGLDIPLSIHTDYDWLLEQGIMIFPRSLTWGKEPHGEWHTFTDEVILAATSTYDDLIIVSNFEDVNLMLKELRPSTVVLSKTSDVWKTIDSYIQTHLKEVIKWSPASSS